MRKYINLFLLIIALNLVSCEKFLEPQEDGALTEDLLINNPTFAEGLLMTAYTELPNDYEFANDVASDDAVTNLEGSEFKRMATGEWKSAFNPISKWEAYIPIAYLNRFLEIYETVIWSNDPNRTDSVNVRKHNLHLSRLKGEAHALRAWYQYSLLKNHSGKSGETLLGYPIINNTLGSDDDWAIPRNTFAECVANIFTDLDTAIANLPADWLDDGDVIDNATSGLRFVNRINGNSARAIKSRVALLAASPAFSESNSVTWAEAATIAGSLLVDLPTMDSKGVTFYTEEISDEILWNRAKSEKLRWEEKNFPPSLFGKGETNPSQSLVDAFPMANGYPIDNALSGYVPETPYVNRDPRLYEYIIHNEAIFKNAPINTFNGADQDGINSLKTSTRTGYYLKKFMSESVDLTIGSEVEATHTYTLIRMTEVVLNFAEAANEAWGPDGDPNGYGFTARTKMEELRARAGLEDPDNYLSSVTGKDDMRKLIHNERRIELCFEGFRFWDIRRWNEQNTMIAPVNGVFISATFIPADSTYNYSYKEIEIEKRIYSPYMIYGSIPYEETLKYDIKQNNGW